MDKIAKIFEIIISEAALGQVIIGEKTYNMKFNTLNVYKLSGNFDSDVPTLVIKDKSNLISLLEKYIETIIKETKHTILNDEDIKYYLTILWFGATFSDFSNPEEYISRVIKFYIDNDDINEEKDSILIRRKDDGFLTPYVLEVLSGNSSITMSYGIINDTCYIYRFSGISYGNINLIINLLEILFKKGITQFKVVSCLPLETTVITNNKTSESLSKKMYQKCASNLKVFNKGGVDVSRIKIFDVLRKLSLEGFINVVYAPFELDEYMHFEINKTMIKSEIEEFIR